MLRRLALAGVFPALIFLAPPYAAPARPALDRLPRVILWAWERPEDLRSAGRDVDVAEALALTVQGWLFGCGDDEKWDIARQAFTELHRLFPETEWAKRTKYWYK